MATLSESYLSEKLTESLHTVKNIKLINHGISAVGDLKYVYLDLKLIVLPCYLELMQFILTL